MTFSPEFENESPRIETQRDCYREAINLGNADIDHTAMVAGDVIPIGDCNSLTFSRTGANVITSGNPLVFNTTNGNGAANINMVFEFPVDIRIAHASLNGNERVIIPGVLGTDFELELSPAGNFNAGTGVLSNGNSSNLETVVYTQVTDISFQIVSQAGVGSSHRITSLQSVVEPEVVCTTLADGTKQFVHALVGKDKINDITDTGVNPLWELIDKLSVPETNSITLKQGFVSSSAIDVQNINANALVAITNELDEGNWTTGVNEAEYTGTPNQVVINMQVDQAIANNQNVQRPTPTVLLQKFDGLAFVTVATSATGYIRDASDAEQSSHGIFYRDTSPGVNPRYRLNTLRDSTITGAVTSRLGQFDLEAFELVEVGRITSTIDADTLLSTLPDFGSIQCD